MKLVYLLLSLGLVMGLGACKKKKEDTPAPTTTDKASLISKKWRLSSYYVNQVKLYLTDGDYWLMNSNKTYTERKFKTISQGTWSLTNNDTQITMNNGVWNITVLNTSQMELSKQNANPTERAVFVPF